jgi:dTDP-4-amino-4,6-dideoxygalactose transaminase
MQAAILRIKLRTLDARLAARRRLAELYTNGLADVRGIAAPMLQPNIGHAYHQYVVRSTKRDALMKHLLAAGVPVGVHYPAAVHQQPAYAAVKRGTLTHTDGLIPQILSLPLHPYLSDDAVAFTLNAIREFTA